MTNPCDSRCAIKTRDILSDPFKCLEEPTWFRFRFWFTYNSFGPFTNFIKWIKIQMPVLFLMIFRRNRTWIKIESWNSKSGSKIIRSVFATTISIKNFWPKVNQNQNFSYLKHFYLQIQKWIKIDSTAPMKSILKTIIFVCKLVLYTIAGRSVSSIVSNHVLLFTFLRR